MEINTNVIYNSFLSNNKRINELLKQAQELTELNINYFLGCLGSQTGTINKNALVSSNKGDTMKFQGKTIFKNKKCNTWYTRYRIDGKQYYISGKTQKEVLATLKSKLNYQKKEKRQITLLDWYKQWLELFKLGKVKQSTVDDYEKVLKHIPQQILNTDIKIITSLQINDIINKIKQERTAQKVFELLKALFCKAKDYDIISKNIMDIIEKPKHTKEQGIALTNDEQSVFEHACKNILHGDLLLVTLFQGLRIGETLAITGSDINLDNMTLKINKAINLHGQEDTTKNMQSNRIMPIFKNTSEILKKYSDFGKQRIFNVTYTIPHKKLKEIVKNTNIRDISLHDLRHTFITNCKNKGIPEHIIQTWVGHRIGSSVTSKVYTHINEQDVTKYISQFNG